MANLGEPTKFITIEFEDKIDVRMDINIVKDELRDHKYASKVYERLAEVSKLSLSGTIQDKDPKEIILSFINRFKINDKIKDIDIRKRQFVLEPDTIVIYNRETSENIVIIKVLKVVLTDDIIKEYYEKVRAGKDSVIMKPCE